MWHLKRQACVPMPFMCPLFQILNYPVTFHWKTSRRNVTSGSNKCSWIKPMERATCPQGTSPRSFLQDFFLLGLFAPHLLSLTCNVPHWRCTKKTPAQLLCQTQQGHKSWEGDSGSRSCVGSLQFQGGSLKTLLLGIEVIAAGVEQSLWSHRHKKHGCNPLKTQNNLFKT